MKNSGTRAEKVGKNSGPRARSNLVFDLGHQHSKICAVHDLCKGLTASLSLATAVDAVIQWQYSR